MTDEPGTEPPKEPFSPVRDADEEALTLAKMLVRGARFASIGVIEPETLDPSVSRVLTGTDIDGTPVILASALAMHMKALEVEPRCSLLMGEPGKGDPMAWPRITLNCQAEKIERDNESYARIRERFLRRHIKAKLYVDFGDFSFVKLHPLRASLNGGFGRAFKIIGKSLIIAPLDENKFDVAEIQFLLGLSAAFPDAADQIANRIFKEKSAGWVVTGIDFEGLEIQNNVKLHRLQFREIISTVEQLLMSYKKLLN